MTNDAAAQHERDAVADHGRDDTAPGGHRSGTPAGGGRTDRVSTTRSDAGAGSSGTGGHGVDIGTSDPAGAGGAPSGSGTAHPTEPGPGPAGAGGAPTGPGPGPTGAESTSSPAERPEAFGYRYGLVRPRQGRYLAGVCGAIGRATNTDPILWRVLLAVLGFFGGIGILVYLAAWLAIPAEGDTGSPVESMLGRGRSSMSPVTVLVLGIVVVLLFSFMVSDAFRAVLLGAAILIVGALLLNRNPTAPPPASYPPADTGPPGPPPGWLPGSDGTAATGSVPAPGPSRSAGPVPPGGYRPAFAPRGPYARSAPHPSVSMPPPGPPKPPRERSPLGAATFSMIFVVIGLVAIADLTNLVQVSSSAYFAAALLTIALGLLLGVWFGRARWLIALGLVTSAALGVSTVVDSIIQTDADKGRVTWAPASYEAMADRYGSRFGDATLDLRAVDFTNRDAQVTLRVDFGTLTVLLPPDVDTTVLPDVDIGDARVFGHWWRSPPAQRARQPSPGGRPGGSRSSVTDLGADGAGGGTLRLNLHVNMGTAEVHR